jgi:hypothetical protein
MLPIRTTRTLVVLSLLSALSITLEVSPDSPCGPQCIDDPTTGDLSMHNASSAFGKDMPCYDWQIVGNDATQVGQKFKKCNNCLRDSNTEYRIALERDTNWFRCKYSSSFHWHPNEHSADSICQLTTAVWWIGVSSAALRTRKTRASAILSTTGRVTRTAASSSTPPTTVSRIIQKASAFVTSITVTSQLMRNRAWPAYIKRPSGRYSETVSQR